MWSFLVDLVRRWDVTRTVVVMDSEEVGPARRYRIQPRRMLAVWGGSLLFTGLIVAALFTFSPLREVIPGYGTEKMRKKARLNAMRLQALQDSIATQRQYVRRLQKLITGGVKPGVPADSASPTGPPAPKLRPSNPQPSEDTSVATGNEPTPPVGWFGGMGGAEDPVAGPSFPVAPPVKSGFPTRGFDAETGHYGLDLAVSKGAYVRAIGAGSVVLADWTRDGGYTIAVQHGGGYLSVYKHNKRLLKQIGDRVETREPLAVSGNTGEMTTGPHLHFELWRNGLAQDPRSYLAEW